MTEPTPRQLEVLVAWIECGGSVGAGERLHLTPVRVRQILAELHTILGTKTSVQAFGIAVREGLIDVDALNLDNAA